MSRHLSAGARCALPLVGALLASGTAGAQSIAQRVRSAGDAEVRMTYATRSGVCGDGANSVALGEALYVYPSMESYGRWSGVECRHGDARIALTVRDGEVELIRTRVGGSWREGRTRIVDLGTVSAPEAARYFVALAEQLDGKQTRNALLPAVIADSVDVLPDLRRLAERTSTPREARRRAIHWMGILGDRSMVEPLERLARADDDDDGIAEASMFALSRLPDDAGIPSLIAIARSNPATEDRRKAVFWLGQSESADARREVRTIAADERQPEEVRAHAAFSLAQGDGATEDDFRFLRTLFDRTNSEDVAEKILLSLSQRGSAADDRWLIEVARDEKRPVEVRKKAVFWAGQGGADIADLVRLYEDVRDDEVKEHMIFVLSQRDERAAIDKLVSIARNDRDRELRKKALFWLGQKDDPAVTRMIADMVTKP